MGGVVIAAIVALLIGGAGGYAGARFLSAAPSPELTSALGQQAALRARVKALQAELDAAKRTRDSLGTLADQKVAAATHKAQADMDTLAQTLAEAGHLSVQLDRANKSLKVSALHINELEKTVADQKAAIDRMKAVATHQDPAMAALQSAYDAVQAKLAAAQKQADAVSGLRARIATLEQQLAERVTDAGTAARQQIAALQQQADQLRASLDSAQKSLADATRKAGQIPQLQAELDQLTDNLAARDKAARDAGAALAAAKAELAASAARTATLTDKITALTASRDGLQTQVATLKATVAKLKDAGKPENVKPTSDGKSGQVDAQATPRDRADVDKALADMPGYDELSADKQAMLADSLVRGDCVTDALKAAYGHVSPVALRSLFRNLGGGC
jgi:DNA repair exonuclease SbcCD ATPase subunit